MPVQLDRTGTSALMPEQVTREIIQYLPENSIVMRLARKLPNMARGQLRMPVFSSLVSAYFVNGDQGLISSTKATWANKFINAEEVACIIPIPKTVLDDVDYDIWAEVKPKVLEAFGVAIDQAVLYGTNKPQSWPAGIVAGAPASHKVSLAALNLYDMIMGKDGSLATVEADGYMVNGHVAAMSLKALLRGLKSTTGEPIFLNLPQDKVSYALDGEALEFPKNGAIDPAVSLLVSGDWSQVVYAMRADMEYSLSTDGVIQDAAGAIVYNLFQQNMVALRCVMRLGWELPNPINRLAQVDATRYPFGILTP